MFMCLLQLLGTCDSILCSVLGAFFYLNSSSFSCLGKGKSAKIPGYMSEEIKLKMLWNNVGGKKEKTLKVRFFFLVGDNLS